MENTKEKTWVEERLSYEIAYVRSRVDLEISPKKTSTLYGTEMYLDTSGGQVRILAYNMDNPETQPLYIYLHGGEFVSGAPETDDTLMMKIAKETNVKIFSIDYSLAPEFPFPKAIEECLNVIDHVKTNAEKLHIDADKIALGGQNAGGNISAAIAVMDNKLQRLGIKCIVLDCPITDLEADDMDNTEPLLVPYPMHHLFNRNYCNNQVERKNPVLSPVYATHSQVSGFAPTLILTNAKDPLCEEGEQFKDKLVEAGVDVTHKRFDSLHRYTEETQNMIINHINKYL